jgi:uncharacterized GH25 family protein
MLRTTLLSCTLLLAGGLAHAADKADAAAKLPPVKPGWTVLNEPAPDAKIERTVEEDDSTRIEQLRVRGQTQKVTVHKKNSIAPDYEILMGDAHNETTPLANSTRSTVGQRVWRVLDF